MEERILPKEETPAPERFTVDNLARGEEVLNVLKRAMHEAQYAHRNNSTEITTRVEFLPSWRMCIKPAANIETYVDGEPVEPTTEEFDLANIDCRIVISAEGQPELRMVGTEPIDLLHRASEVRAYVLNPLAGHVVAAWHADAEHQYHPPVGLGMATDHPARQAAKDIVPIVFKI